MTTETDAKTFVETDSAADQALLSTIGEDMDIDFWTLLCEARLVG